MHHTCYTGEAEHHLSDGRVGRFTPSGPLHVVHVRGKSRRGRAGETVPENVLPFDSERDPWAADGLAARLIVGLKVGNESKWTIDDVMRTTYEFLTDAKLPGNSSFLAQKGIYGGIFEDSVQVLVFDEAFPPTPIDAWTKVILALGAFLRQRLEQESVIVEIQRGGVAQSLQAVKKREKNADA